MISRMVIGMEKLSIPRGLSASLSVVGSKTEPIQDHLQRMPLITSM